MTADFRVFLSAVTSEFGMARDALANDLQARDVQVRVQRSFRQEADSDTLLRLLHDYIAGCNAVVCVIGRRSGGRPPPAAAAAFAHMLPPGISEASYTQWEFFFAQAHKRRLSLYLAEPEYGPDEPTGNDFPGLQEAFIGHIKAEGLHRVPFSNRDQLRAEDVEGAVAGGTAGQADRAALCQPRQPVQGPPGVSAPPAREPDPRQG
jgi:hypothetical protein